MEVARLRADRELLVDGNGTCARCGGMVVEDADGRLKCRLCGRDLWRVNPRAEFGPSEYRTRY
jgi:hypothetical protein